MEIDKRYFQILGKSVYNKRLKKYGHISSVEVMYSIGGYCIGFRVFYDVFDNDSLLFFEDFEKKEVCFVIITDVDIENIEEYNKRQAQDIMAAMGDKFSEDMIKYVKESKRVKKNQENDEKNVQMLHTDLVGLDYISAEVMAKDFYSRELYIKYKRKAITKEELLFALINHLAQELKRVEDRNNAYFFKYELSKEIEQNQKRGMRMNEKVKAHKDICEYLNKLYEQKNHDYGDSFHQTFLEEGMAMARIRLGDKLSRFKTLTRTGDQLVNDESIRDTLLDLANYAIMTIMELDGQN